MFTRLGLSKRLNLILISLNIIILLSVTSIASLSSQAFLYAQAVDRFSAKNREAVRDLDQAFSDISDMLEDLGGSLSQLGDLTESDDVRRAILTHLEAVQMHELISSVTVIRPDGAAGVLILEDPGKYDSYRWRVFRIESTLPADNNILRAYNQGQAVWFQQSHSYFDEYDGQVISLVVPYEHADGNRVLWVDMPLQNLQESINAILNRVGLSADTLHGYNLLVDDYGVSIMTHFVSEVDNATDITPIVLTRLERAERVEGTIYRMRDPVNDDRPSLYAVDTIRVSDWRMISALPEDEIQVLPGDIFAPMGFVALLGIIALYFTVNWFIKRYVVNPLLDLQRSAAEIGSGNMRFMMLHQKKRDEIGHLALAMDAMRQRLRESYDALAEWSNTLEQRVEDRTEQLSLAQREAEANAAQLRAVYDESLIVVHEKQLGPVLDMFIDRILLMLNSSYCSIWLLTADNEHQRLVATNDPNFDPNKTVTILHKHEGLAGHVIQDQHLVVLEDYAQYERRTTLPNRRGDAFVRAVCAPLMYAGQVVGAVVVGRSKDDPVYSASEQRYLTLFANLVSPSVRNAQLFVQLQDAVNEAKRANQVKTRFLASVTHELRTPLNLVINNMDFMRIGVFGDVNEEQKMRLDQTLRSSEHLLYLINDLLDVSKIDAGEMEMMIAMSEVTTMIEDVIDNAEVLLQRYNKEHLDLRIEVEDDLPDVPMDTRRIRQVLNNLLSNAIKFTAEGNVTFKVFKGQLGLHFSVHDTGMGIPDNEMNLLFAAFERTSTAKKEGIEGTGLGLPISRFIINKHGSDLSVTSEVGAGTTFAFVLPFEQIIGTQDDEDDDATLSIVDILRASDQETTS